MEASVNTVAPTQMRMRVRNPAGFSWRSRSLPTIAPHRIDTATSRISDHGGETYCLTSPSELRSHSTPYKLGPAGGAVNSCSAHERDGVAPKTSRQVVVHQPRRLHEGVDNRRSDEVEAAFFQIARD